MIILHKKKIQGFSLDRKNAYWLAEACEKEGLSQSQVVNRAIKKMRESGILW